MGLFNFFKREGPKQKRELKAKVEMYGYENGRRVEFRESASEENEIDWKKHLSMSLALDSEIRPLESAMVGFAVALKEPQKVDDEIIMLESLIGYYEEIKSKCYALGPDYIDYFTRSWEEIRAGKPDGPGYVTKYKKRLVYVRENYNHLLEQQILYEKESENLEDRVFSVLKSSNNILQTDVYKLFHFIVKPDIQSFLYAMEKDGRISREKSGRTYMIHYIK